MTRYAKASSARSNSDHEFSRDHALSGNAAKAFLLAIVAALAVCAPSALAAQTHPYTGVSFGPDGVGGSESFERLQGVAVDPASSDVFAYDGAAGKVYKFDEAGNPVDFSALGGNVIESVGGGGGGAEEEIAVAPAGSPAGTAGDIYVANNGNAIQVYAPDGTKLPGEIEQDGETCGVATDPSGNLYAGVYSSTVNKYTPNANPPTTANKATATVEHGICNVAADGLGNVYAANYEGSGLFVLEGMADTTPAEVDPRANTMAIAPGSSDLYADRQNEVVQYDSSGFPIGSFGAGEISESHGIAVNSGATKIYVGTPSQLKVFGPQATAPPGEAPAATDAATGITNSSATFHGRVNPEGIPLEACYFEYGVPSEYGQSVPCAETPAEIGTGSAPVPVHASVSGLSGATEYQFRLVAENEFGTGQAAKRTFKTTGPAVVSASILKAGTNDATFSGVVNPNGEATTYRFEYVTQAEFEASEFAGAQQLPEGGDAIGSGSEGVEVEQQATGLVAGTKYHLRLVAENAGGEAESEDLVFRAGVQPIQGLPDGRVYEQVTPPGPVEKNATNMLGETSLAYASPDGDAATYYAITGGDTDSTVEYPIYIGDRGSNSWTSAGFNAPATTGTRTVQLASTEDLNGGYSASWFPGGEGGLYLREFDGNLVTLARGGHDFEDTRIAAENGEEVLFESLEKLTPDAISGVSNLYVWQKSTGELHLVDVLPGETVSVNGAYAGSWDWVAGEVDPSYAIHGGARAYYYTQDTLSRDGSKAFFTTADTYQVYMRQNPASSSATTTQISASQKTNGTGAGGTDPNGPQPASYLGATPDGSYVFFMSHEELTNDANTGTEDEGEDLYRYDTSSGQLVDLTPYAEGEGARVRGLGGTSADGSYVYFVARGVLAEGAAGSGQKLYLWHDGQVQFITNLSGDQNDSVIWANTRLNVNGLIDGGYLPQKGIRVTPDGRTISFASDEDHPEFKSNGKNEIYRWEYEGDGLQCLSCNPSGLSAKASASLRVLPNFFIQPSLLQSLSSRNLSPDGKRMFFATPEALVSRDVNGAQDVYEWEAEGKGSCASDVENGGCLYLISTGTSPDPSYFSDASRSGDDVFFFTTQQLVGQDKDELSDLYDARVGGGLASQNPVPVRPCEGEGCLGVGTGASEPQQRGTSTFAGPGNEKPKKHKKKRHAEKKNHKKTHHRHSGGNR